MLHFCIIISGSGKLTLLYNFFVKPHNTDHVLSAFIFGDFFLLGRCGM